MSETNPASRLEAFCDGVFAIALTLLIIDIKIPSTEKINNTVDFWLAIRHILPSIFAFLLSFAIILITWVNHHYALRLGNKISSRFIYANGFLLLTVVFLPFPTSLIGEYLLTDYASPAVILYDGTMALQALSWVFMTGTAINDQLAKNEESDFAIRTNRKNGFFALALYSFLTILAIWFPFAVAIFTTLTWIYWAIWGIRKKHQ